MNQLEDIKKIEKQNIPKSEMLDTIRAIENLVDDDFSFEIDIKLSELEKRGYQFTNEEVIEMGKRFMDIYILVHGFETRCCQRKKDILKVELLKKGKSK